MSREREMSDLSDVVARLALDAKACADPNATLREMEIDRLIGSLCHG
jgi:hypothetical protein